MGNLITYRARPELECVSMSNGLTSVFVSVLSLAASALAQTDRERELAVWFAAHDQSVFGQGVVGFDVGELPWSAESLASDRAFVLRAVDAAKAKTGWDRLGYAPREQGLVERLEAFRALVCAFDLRDASARDGAENFLFDERPSPSALCEKHAVYLHAAGCVVCNDQ